MACGAQMLSCCITARRGLYVMGVVLAVWSFLTFLSSVALTFGVFYNKLIGDIGETGYGFHYLKSVKAFTATMEVLSVVTLLQFASCMVLLYSIYKEKLPTIHICTGVYAILTSLVFNVPMLEAILCFHNAMFSNWMIVAGSFIIFLALLHAGLAAVFTVNLRHHYKEEDDDFHPFANEDSIGVTDSPIENTVQASVADPATTNW